MKWHNFLVLFLGLFLFSEKGWAPPDDDIDNQVVRQNDLGTQQGAQDQAQDTKNAGGAAAEKLGQILQLVGAIMVAVGTAQENPPLVTKGLYTLAGGLAASLVGSLMKGNASESGGNSQALDNLAALDFTGGPGLADLGLTPGLDLGNTGGTSGVPGVGVGDGPGGASGAFDPDTLKDGAIGDLLAQFEAETGNDGTAFANSILNGDSIADTLAGATGIDASDIQAGIDAAKANADFSDASGGVGADLKELADGLGLEELVAGIDSGTSFAGGAGAGGLNKGGGGSLEVSPFDFSQFKKTTNDAYYDPESNKNFDFNSFSDQVKRQLAKEGRTNKSLFQIVTGRYRVVTPVMLGLDLKSNSIETTTFQEDI